MVRKQRPRAERREKEREAAKLTRDLERLAQLERGGSAERPIDVVSASLVDLHARDAKCAVCGGAVELVEHAAVVVGGVSLRVARVRCRVCGRKREVFFRVVGVGAN